MTFVRYIIAQSDAKLPDGSLVWDNFHRAGHLWEHGDGTSMYRIECDDPGFERLAALHNAGALTALPSLGAPASALSGRSAAFVAKHDPGPGGAADTVLNILRRIRNSKGLGELIMIDQPY